MSPVKVVFMGLGDYTLCHATVPTFLCVWPVAVVVYLSTVSGVESAVRKWQSSCVALHQRLPLGSSFFPFVLRLVWWGRLCVRPVEASCQAQKPPHSFSISHSLPHQGQRLMDSVCMFVPVQLQPREQSGCIFDFQVCPFFYCLKSCEVWP